MCSTVAKTAALDSTRPPSWSVYLLRCSDGTLYTGIATDVAARVKTHNEGKGAKYTRARLPVTLLYQEDALTHGDALRREMAIKRLSRTQKLSLIASDAPTA